MKNFPASIGCNASFCGNLTLRSTGAVIAESTGAGKLDTTPGGNCRGAPPGVCGNWANTETAETATLHNTK